MKQCLSLLLMMLLLAPVTLLAAEMPGVEGMLIKADRMDHDAASDLLTATGTVEVTWQGMTMTADQAVFNRQSSMLVATGNVVMAKAGDTMWGDRLIMDTETGRAEMENSHIFMGQGNFRASGAQVARLADDQYALHQGEFTTCDAENPSWKFGATDFDVTVEEYATGSNVVFYVKNVPVFYFPYLILPVKRERQSGFLFPSFGSSTKRGVFAEIPFYWAISPSQDATFTLDIQAKRGVGLGADYRYLRSRTSTGTAGGYIIYDNNEDKVRGQFVQYHREQLPDNLTLIASINLTSDEAYLRDYSDKNGEYNRQFYDSRIMASKSWNHWLAAAQAIYTQDFAAGSNATTLQRLPELMLYGVRQPLPYLPLQFDLDLTATNYYRENGMQGQRAMLTPRLVSNQSLFGGRLNARMNAGVQLRAYNVTDAQPGTDEQAVVAVPDLNAELASSFSATVGGDLLGFKRLRHELIPAVSYRYVVDRDQQQYPLFDQNDRFPHQNLVYLSLTSHLGGKLEDENNGAQYRHLQTLRLKQGYSLHGDRPDLLSLVPDDQRPWSTLTLESETWLHRNLRLLADAGYNHYEGRFTSTALGGDFNDGRGNSIGLSYRWADQQVKYLEGRVTTTLLRPVYLSYTQRYSFDRKDFLEQELDVEYRHQCWNLFGRYQERLDNRSFTINFNLAGLFTGGSSKTRSLATPEERAN